MGRLQLGDVDADTIEGDDNSYHGVSDSNAVSDSNKGSDACVCAAAVEGAMMEDDNGLGARSQTLPSLRLDDRG